MVMLCLLVRQNWCRQNCRMDIVGRARLFNNPSRMADRNKAMLRQLRASRRKLRSDQIIDRKVKANCPIPYAVKIKLRLSRRRARVVCLTVTRRSGRQFLSQNAKISLRVRVWLVMRMTTGKNAESKAFKLAKSNNVWPDKASQDTPR